MWLRPNHPRPGGRSTVADAELLLSGRTITQDRPSGGRSRVWIVINALAHSERGRLEELRDQQTGARPGGIVAVVAFLAAEVLLRSPTDEELVETQRDVLVPLELTMLGASVPTTTTPAQLASLVITALARRPVPRER